MSKKLLTIVLVAFLSMTIISTLPHASAAYKSGKSAYLRFLGQKITSKGIKYRYKVFSGARDQRIKSWTLKSNAFKYYDIQSTSSYRLNGKTLKFTEAFKNFEKRWVSFILETRYKNLGIGWVKAQLKLKWMENFWIKGPVMPS